MPIVSAVMAEGWALLRPSLLPLYGVSPEGSWTFYMKAQGSKRPRKKVPVVSKVKVQSQQASLPIYSIDQSSHNPTQIQVEEK